MIKKLKIKFVLIIMSILTVIFVLIFGSINLFMHNVFESNSTMLLKQIAMNDGFMPQKPKPPNQDGNKAPHNSIDIKDINRHFSVIVNNNGDIINVISPPKYTLSDDEITKLVATALERNTDTGKIQTQRYLIVDKSYGKLLIFLDASLEDSMLFNLRWISLGIGILGLLILFFISLLLSKWAVKPVQIAFDKQQQFVSDASHELRTPLTVIGTNADVLESEIGDNKWLSFIKSETTRMNELVNNLLYLTRYDNNKDICQFKEFNLSNSLLGTILPFESLIFESDKTFNIDIDDNIFIYADESKLRQLTIILIDNAIKNCSDRGTISVSLKTDGSKKILSVYNTGNGIDDNEKDKIFERFYRSDASRARETGGYGLGLAIAKSIVDEHKGKITVKSEKGKFAEFIVTLN